MTDTFFTIVIVVAVVGVVVSLTPIAWPFHVANQIGKTGSWFHHADEDDLHELPDGNVNDPTIPFRPLRGRN